MLNVKFYGMYIQDDWKVSPRITLNLGLRDEYETALYDPQHNFSQGLNLSAPAPEMVANPPQMPAAATISSATTSITGRTMGVSPVQPPWYVQRPKLALQPRVGLAYRIDDKTALRFGYARYLVPYEMNIALAPVSGYETVGFLEPPFLGMTGYQYTLAPAFRECRRKPSRIPIRLDQPAVTDPRKAYGTNLGRGGESLLWYDPNQQKARNDRFNFNLQRQLVNQIVVSGTYFLNIGNQQYTKALNQINPALEMQYQNQLNIQVANPFYHYLNQT